MCFVPQIQSLLLLPSFLLFLHFDVRSVRFSSVRVSGRYMSVQRTVSYYIIRFPVEFLQADNLNT